MENGALFAMLRKAEQKAERRGIYLEYEVEAAAGPLPEGLPALAGAMLDAALDIAQGAGLEKWAYFRLEQAGEALTLHCGASGGVEDARARELLARIGAAAPGCRVAADKQEDGVQLTAHFARAAGARA